MRKENRKSNTLDWFSFVANLYPDNRKIRNIAGLQLSPRVLIFLVFPAFLFTAVFLISNRNKAWIHNILPHWLIFYQTFRIAIESLFVFSVAKGILPELVTIKGYNFDMLFACTAPIVGYYVYRKSQITDHLP